MPDLRPLSADQIGDVGRQLYGERWQSPLANALGINPRLLRYWLSGELAPSLEDERRLVALVEYAAAETARRAASLADRSRQVQPADRWSFETDDLEVIDRHVVRHRPTGSEMSFYDYATPPAPGEVPGGTISKMGDMASADLTRFQIAAWGKLARFRYGRRDVAGPYAFTVGEALAERRRRLGFSRTMMVGWAHRSQNMIAEVEEGRTNVSGWYAKVVDDLERFQRNNPDQFLNVRRILLASTRAEVS